MKSSAWAWRAAQTTSSGVACGRPRRTLSIRLALNRYGRWGTQATRARHASASSVSSGTPPAVIVPLCGAMKPSSKAAIVLLPAPLGPTSATCSPVEIVKLTPSNAARCPSA